MPQTPVRPTRSDGEFADLFARKARTPLRGFLPGRRVWNAVGGSAAVVLVIAGATAVVSRIDFSSGSEDRVATAAEKKDAVQGRTPADSGTPSASASSAAPERQEGDKGPAVVYLPAPGGDGNAGSGGSGRTDDGGTTGTTRTSEPRSTAPTQQASTGFLWSDGTVEGDSNPYWDQSAVTVQTTKTLKSLKVVVKITQTGGVAGTGTWTNLGDKVSVASASSSGELDYVVTLKPGITVDPGTYIFRFQYNHNQGARDAGGDRYNVTATSTAGATEFRKGGF
ncbi:hypothetical protein ACIBU0_30365 [Streptomyces sp. NPDC049627]|uniref:hypothetical protein n=1 Tax=Streptomyces sp. NPDC049627 TaxID=3365595 RepID=UPI0037B14B24